MGFRRLRFPIIRSPGVRPTGGTTLAGLGWFGLGGFFGGSRGFFFGKKNPWVGGFFLRKKKKKKENKWWWVSKSFFFCTRKTVFFLFRRRGLCQVFEVFECLFDLKALGFQLDSPRSPSESSWFINVHYVVFKSGRQKHETATLMKTYLVSMCFRSISLAFY